ncbi:MAG TPA: hypothetical protein V6D37_03765 [Candidatus Sericytochromatia bacterium]
MCNLLCYCWRYTIGLMMIVGWTSCLPFNYSSFQLKQGTGTHRQGRVLETK